MEGGGLVSLEELCAAASVQMCKCASLVQVWCKFGAKSGASLVGANLLGRVG